jgi:phosphatidylinositol alpha-1,6-mannosyltransferase
LAVKSKVKPASVEVIHPGVDWEKFSASHRRAERKDFSLEGRRVILFVGRLARRKGMKEFIDRCFDQIVREVPDVCLVIVGENPTDSMVHRDDVSSEIQALVQGKNLASHVRFLGWLAQADMAGIYGVSDVMVVPAVPVRGDVEGFGIVLLEAGAAAVPSVAFRVGGIPDAIGDGRGGVLIEPGDYDRMSQAIIHLLRNDQARASMGRHAQKRIRDDFGWETTAQRYEALFLKSQRQGGS